MNLWRSGHRWCDGSGSCQGGHLQVTQDGARAAAVDRGSRQWVFSGMLTGSLDDAMAKSDWASARGLVMIMHTQSILLRPGEII